MVEKMVRQAGSFSFEKPVDMLEKLAREINRFADSTCNEKDLVDHGINFSMTAWHLIDWSWKFSFERDEKKRGEVFGKESVRSQDDFRKALINRCPELALCRDIPNNAKHFDGKLPKESKREGKQVLETRTSAAAATVPASALGQSALGNGALDGPGYELGADLWKLKIVDDKGNTYDALDVFNRVKSFWTTFVHRYAS